MNLEDWRNEIDIIDQKIVRLIGQRTRIVRKIGSIKRNAGLPAADPDRERRVLGNICGCDPDGLSDEAIMRIFKEILRESRRIQSSTVAIDQRRALETRC